jgi:hypothetical protein
MMFTVEQYLGKHEHTAVHAANADYLVRRTALLMDKLMAMGVEFKNNPKTGTVISGDKFGGFRPQDCPIGAPKSAHKLGLAVDLYDPSGCIDKAIMEHQELLVEYGVYIEHPSKTEGWSHWAVVPPLSNKHVFYP